MSKKEIFLRVVKMLGLFALGRYFSRKKVIILTYHGVSSFIPEVNRQYEYRNVVFAKDFRWQMEFLLHYYNKISIEQLVDFISGKISLPKKRYFLITFDDGFKNQLEVATPILKEYGISGVFFISTNCVGKSNYMLWTDKIIYLIFTTKKKKVKVTLEREYEFSLEREQDRERAAKKIRSYLKSAPKEEINRIISILLSQLDDVEIFPSDKHKERYEFLDWSDVINLSKSGMVIGSHTTNHLILSTLSLEESKMEMIKSKEEIEKHLNKPCYYFSYPDGEASDFEQEHKKMLKEIGYKCAFSQIIGSNDTTKDLYELKRINIDSGLTPLLFEAKICGFIDIIKRFIPKRWVWK